MQHCATELSAIFRGSFVRIGCFHQPQERMPPLRVVVTWVTCEGLQWKQFSGAHLSGLTFQDGCSLVYSLLPFLALIELLLHSCGGSATAVELINISSSMITDW